MHSIRALLPSLSLIILISRKYQNERTKQHQYFGKTLSKEKTKNTQDKIHH